MEYILNSRQHLSVSPKLEGRIDAPIARTGHGEQPPFPHPPLDDLARHLAHELADLVEGEGAAGCFGIVYGDFLAPQQRA